MFMLTSNNWSGSLDVLGRFFSVILAVAFVMALAYFATRWLAGARYIRHSRSNLKLIEGLSVGYQSTVQLIQVGERFILIGVTKEHVSYLTEIPKEAITQPVTIAPFEKYLEKLYTPKNSRQAGEDSHE